MRTALVVDSAAALAWAALTAPLGAAGVVVDPGTETLVAPPAAFRELIEPGARLETRAALAAGGAVHGGRLPVLLRAGVGAVRSPSRQLTLSVAGGAADIDAWLAPPAAALTTVDPDGRVRLVPLPAAAVAATLVRAMGLVGDAARGEAAERRLAPGALAALLAAGGDEDLPGVHTHARLAAPGEILEVVGHAGGWRRVIVLGEGDEIVLAPAGAGELREAVAAVVGGA